MSHRNKPQQKREQRLVTALAVLRRIDAGDVLAKYTGVSTSDPRIETFSVVNAHGASEGVRFGVFNLDGAWNGIAWVALGEHTLTFGDGLGPELAAFRPTVPRVFFKIVWAWPHGPSFPFVTGPLAPPEL